MSAYEYQVWWREECIRPMSYTGGGEQLGHLAQASGAWGGNILLFNVKIIAVKNAGIPFN
jgi:hypothetical protein